MSEHTLSLCCCCSSTSPAKIDLKNFHNFLIFPSPALVCSHVNKIFHLHYTRILSERESSHALDLMMLTFWCLSCSLLRMILHVRFSVCHFGKWRMADEHSNTTREKKSFEFHLSLNRDLPYTLHISPSPSSTSRSLFILPCSVTSLLCWVSVWKVPCQNRQHDTMSSPTPLSCAEQSTLIGPGSWGGWNSIWFFLRLWSLSSNYFPLLSTIVLQTGWECRLSHVKRKKKARWFCLSDSNWKVSTRALTFFTPSRNDTLHHREGKVEEPEMTFQWHLCVVKACYNEVSHRALLVLIRLICRLKVWLVSLAFFFLRIKLS